MNAILEAVEQTDLTIKQVRLSFSQLLLAFSVAASHSSDSIGSPYNWKKSKQIGRTDYSHTDTLVLLLKFRYKLIGWQIYQTQLECVWYPNKQLRWNTKKESKKDKKFLTIFVWNYCPLELFYTCTQQENYYILLSVPKSQGCIWSFMCFD